MRQSGILMHITSLPGPGGIGCLGKEAYLFADFLHDCGMTLWQVLPLGPTGYGESPYQSASIYAGNPMLISIDKLASDGLVHLEKDEQFVPERDDCVAFDEARASKEALLRRAFQESEKQMLPDICQFIRDEKWVLDYALFIALKKHFHGKAWQQWPDENIKLRKKKALLQYRIALDEEVRYHIFCQFLFFRQWSELKAYCNDKGIQLFGDMPIYVAEDSADAWTHPEVFQLDRNRVPKRVAGVPPDCFSADGQLWGNPLYRWTYLYFHHYDWWVDRMRGMSRLYDIVRIDHFIGFANYYSIPHGAPNARNGKWVIGPGKKLFRRLKKELPKLQVIAEDLGVQSERVTKLLAYTGYPGMKVAAFGFGGDPKENLHFPANWTENAVAYTGTHDNDTTGGFLDSADEQTLKAAKNYLHFDTIDAGIEAFIRCVLQSPCKMAVIPMQDVLHLGNDARMNLPGTVGGNWAWRMKPNAITPTLTAHLRALNQESNRLA